MISALKIDSDDYTGMQMYIKPLSVYFKIAKMINFVSCAFYHNF